MKKMILLGTMILATSFAHAADENAAAPAAEEGHHGGMLRSEYFFLPGAHTNAADLVLGLGSSSQKMQQNGVDLGTNSTSSSSLGFKYTYGITDNVAINVATDWGKDKVDPPSGSSISYTGMNNINLGVDAGVSFMRFGGIVSISPGNAKGADSSTDGNRYTGGNSIAPYFGMIFNAGKWNFGGRLTDTLSGEAKSDDIGGGTTKGTPGNIVQLEGFFEFNYGAGIVGAGGGVSYRDTTTYSSDDGSSFRVNAMTTPFISVAGEQEFNSLLSLVYHGKYGVAHMAPASTYDKTDLSIFSTDVALRFTF
jgi:hypothetical protein